MLFVWPFQDLDLQPLICMIAKLPKYLSTLNIHWEKDKIEIYVYMSIFI